MGNQNRKILKFLLIENFQMTSCVQELLTCHLKLQLHELCIKKIKKRIRSAVSYNAGRSELLGSGFFPSHATWFARS